LARVGCAAERAGSSECDSRRATDLVQAIQPNARTAANIIAVTAETFARALAYPESEPMAANIQREVPMQRIVLTAALFSALAFSPASAKMMTCTGENMAKSQAAMAGMPDSPGKMTMARQMGMANMEMSKGNMRGACKHYMDAQKMSMMKSGM
jgi:hypothetical protein